METFHGFRLDPFQKQAIDYISQGRSVIVSAPTGVGKTLVADYLVDQAIRMGKKVIYTAPIKALSNQKYKEFKSRFGEESVGIVTGDISINPRGDVLIMTTEIFRNMVLAQETFLEEISHCIFDEIHYIDSDRGVAWEESIIFAPPHIRFLGLSATIGNLDQLVGWLSEVRGEEFARVVENERVVPLKHFYFYANEAGKGMVVSCESQEEPLVLPKSSKAQHIQLVETIKGDSLPALFFVFSRRQCSDKSREASHAFNLLKPEELARTEAVLERFASMPGLQGSGDFRLLRSVTRRGFAYHHAGLLPILKDMVEELFAAGLIKVLYCTETFSVGINYPVKAVCFDGQHKFDGRSIRPMKAQEYYQMAGRAGRRGMDTEGRVYTLLTDKHSNVENYCHRELERLNSQFRLTYNSILNLLKYSRDNIEIILHKSFAGYLAAADRKKADAHYKKLLQEKEGFEKTLCSSINDSVCPVTHQHRKRRLKTYEGLLRRCRYKNIPLLQKRDILREELLDAKVKQCPYQTRNTCSRLKRPYNAVLAKVTEAEQTVGNIPSLDVFVKQFKRKVRLLEKMSYVDQGSLLARGEVGAQVYIQELLVTELIFAGVLEDLVEEDLVALFLGVDYPWRKFDSVLPVDELKLQPWFAFINRLIARQELSGDMVYSSYLAPIGYRFARGDSLHEVLNHCNLDEGDVVGLFRREIDLFRQMRHALKDVPAMADKLTRCIELIDRDLVQVML